jgi:hypothetical protein
MENKIEKAYNEFKEISTRCESASETGNEKGVEKAREDYKVWKAKYAVEGKAFQEAYGFYKESRQNGNEVLHAKIYPHNKIEFLKCLKENGFTEFAFSCPCDELEHTSEFLELGCRLKGITTVKGNEKPFSEEREIIYALVIEIG